MGLLTSQHTGDPDCECCGPNTRKQVTTTVTPLGVASRYAFLLCLQRREQRLPRDIVRRIVLMAESVERRVVTTSVPQSFMPSNARRPRHQKFGSGSSMGGGAGLRGGGDPSNSMSMAGLCIEDDGLPM
jgi:hypothetical protein